jgi:hypothetical protein
MNIISEIEKTIDAHERALLILERLKWRGRSLEMDRDNHKRMVLWFGNYEGAEKRLTSIKSTERMAKLLQQAYADKLNTLTA